MSIIFLILKILGITIGILLGIVILLLLMVLFVPIRYRLEVSKDQIWKISGRFTWLFHIVKIPILFDGKEFSVTLRILGFFKKKLFPSEETEEKPKKKKAKKKKVKQKQVTDTNVLKIKSTDSTTKRTTSMEAKVESTIKKQDSKYTWKDKIRTKIQKLKYTICKIYDRIKQLKEQANDLKVFLEDEHTKETLKIIKKYTFYLLKKIGPKKAKGWVHFGLEDPSLTGEILGGYSILYPFLKDQITIVPDFTEVCLEGSVSIKGYLRLSTLVYILWKLWRDKHIRYVYQKLNL